MLGHQKHGIYNFLRDDLRTGEIVKLSVSVYFGNIRWGYNKFACFSVSL